MISPEQLREYVIQPVCRIVGGDPRNAEELLIVTAGPESNMGEYLHQLGSGPACGIYQMEPRTHDDIWDNFLTYRYDLAQAVRGYRSAEFEDDSMQMCGNLYYATAMARAFYLRFSEPIPDCHDIEGLAQYYKKYWNTRKGASTVQATIEAYKYFT